MNTGIRLVRGGCLLLGACIWLGAAPVQVAYDCVPFYSQFSTGSPFSVAGEVVCPGFDTRVGTLVNSDGNTIPVFVMVSFGLVDLDGTVTLRNGGAESFLSCEPRPLPGLICAPVFGIDVTIGPLPGEAAETARRVSAGVEAFGRGGLAPGETRTFAALEFLHASPTLVPGPNLDAYVSADLFAIPVQIDFRAIEIPFVEVTGYSFRPGVDWAKVVYTYETPEPGTLGMMVLAGVGAVVSRRLLHRAG